MEIIDILLKITDTDVNAKDKYCNYRFNDQLFNEITPLILAMNVNNTKIFDLLLNHPNIDVNKTVRTICDRTPLWTPLHVSIMLNENDFLYTEKLLKHPNIDVNFKANFDESIPALSETSSFYGNNHFDVYYTPLHLAVELEKLKIIELLLSHPNILLNEVEHTQKYISIMALILKLLNKQLYIDRFKKIIWIY